MSTYLNGAFGCILLSCHIVIYAIESFEFFVNCFADIINVLIIGKFIIVAAVFYYNIICTSGQIVPSL